MWPNSEEARQLPGAGLAPGLLRRKDYAHTHSTDGETEAQRGQGSAALRPQVSPLSTRSHGPVVQTSSGQHSCIRGQLAPGEIRRGDSLVMSLCSLASPGTTGQGSGASSAPTGPGHQGGVQKLGTRSCPPPGPQRERRGVARAAEGPGGGLAALRATGNRMTLRAAHCLFPEGTSGASAVLDTLHRALAGCELLQREPSAPASAGPALTHSCLISCGGCWPGLWAAWPPSHPQNPGVTGSF